ncbi:MAG TPA: hypothetical protein VGY66_22255 [Gemmataceae bacterium]|jgi:hypothetical protein|nr:hypothetical protein [Gemmataceae bacterium]
MKRLLANVAISVATFLFAFLAAPSAAVGADDSESLDLPAISGWVMTPDGQTLIVSTGSGGEIIYVDTVAGKVGKHVELDFQPTALAVQGDELIAANKGAAQLRVLDLATGKEKKTIQLSGSPVKSLACHPAKGYVYAANSEDAIFAADLKAGKAWKTKGQGAMLAIDPSDGSAVYAGTQRAMRDQLIMQRVGRQTQMRVGRTGRFATLAKFQVEGNDLKLAGANSGAVINASHVAVSPDGKRVAIVGGGGIESATDKRRSYDIPVYSAADVNTMDGQIEVGAYPSNIAFHSVLSIGVAEQSGGSSNLILFKTKSLAKIKTLQPHAERGLPGGSSILAFGGKGRKIIYGMQSGRGGTQTTKLYLLPLELTAEQQEQLKGSP